MSDLSIACNSEMNTGYNPEVSFGYPCIKAEYFFPGTIISSPYKFSAILSICLVISSI